MSEDLQHEACRSGPARDESCTATASAGVAAEWEGEFSNRDLDGNRREIPATATSILSLTGERKAFT